jgi:hypothetical protein
MNMNTPISKSEKDRLDREKLNEVFKVEISPLVVTPPKQEPDPDRRSPEEKSGKWHETPEDKILERKLARAARRKNVKKA